MDYESTEPILERIFHEGYQLLLQKGMRKMSILDITRAVDIATGTFYHYFPTKEDFVYQMIVFYREDIFRSFNNHLTDGKMSRDCFRLFLLDLIDNYKDVFSLLTPIEQQRLRERYPLNHSDTNSNEMTFAKQLISCLSGVREGCDWRIFANLLSGLSKLFFNRTAMYPDQFRQTMEIFVDAMLDYTFQ